MTGSPLSLAWTKKVLRVVLFKQKKMWPIFRIAIFHFILSRTQYKFLFWVRDSIIESTESDRLSHLFFLLEQKAFREKFSKLFCSKTTKRCAHYCGFFVSCNCIYLDDYSSNAFSSSVSVSPSMLDKLGARSVMPAGNYTALNTGSSLMVRCPVTKLLAEAMIPLIHSLARQEPGNTCLELSL